MPSRRDLIRMTGDELLAFLDEQRIVQVATIGPTGRPHLMPLWYVVADGGGGDAPAEPANVPALRAWTYAKSQKARNLERDPRATLGIEAGVEYQELRGATLECDVALETDPERVAEEGAALFERYATADGELEPEVREMVAQQARKRVALRFVATRVVSWDHRKLGGTY
jgi:PPOX class probable F420-dependent enzyme